jgi:hypothetical protein
MSSSSSRYSTTKYLFIKACLWAGFSFFMSCSNDTGIGTNVLPPGDVINANFKDTATVWTSMVIKDSVPTNGVSDCMLGSYTDPIFGMAKASFYIHVLLPPATGFTFADSAKLDSVVLRLPFTGSTSGSYYGSLDPQTIEVYQMSDSLAVGKAYYSSTNLKHYASPIGKQTITPEPNYYPTISFNSVPTTYYPLISIRIDTGWAHDSILKKATPGAAAFASNAAFLELLRGLYITVSNPLQLPGQGGILYLNPTISGLSGSGLFFYYHYPKGAIGNTYFQLGNDYGYFSHIDHDYSGTPFYAANPVKDSVYSPTITYLQAMGGVKVKIRFPYLKNWVSKGRVIVNRAEVEIPAYVNDMGNYAAPNELYLVGINDTGATYALPDQYLPYYGGIFDQFRKVYVFDIAQYIQAVLDGKTIDHGFYLVIGGSAVTANRVPLYGGYKTSSTSLPRLRLKMYYTPLKS